ncbi:MAG: VWA domain-containing protein [Anaerolineae bacterium]|nr:VWA domain-containing protein [Anaerolineae bacterium]
MKQSFYGVFVVCVVLGMLLAGCSCPAGIPFIGGGKVTITIYYGSEKEEWLEPLAAEYNAQRNETVAGSTIVVEATPMGSIESANGIVDGTIQPTVWSPASSVYIPVANAGWKQSHAEDLVVGSPKDLVLSPVVIAMWQPMAETLGWPDKSLGWADIAALSTSEEGWAAYGYPEWGEFKLGHTHPNHSNSGIVSIIAETYAGAGKQRDLTMDDLTDPAVRDFVAAVESSIIHYGRSTGFFASRMFERGPSYLSAAVMYENLVVAQESKRLSGESFQLPVVAIYPKEGTFWSNHPYAILNAPWVTAEQREAAEAFEAFLLDRPQQFRALEYGFRPADPSIPLTAPLDAAHGVDPAQPKTVLEVPSAEVIAGIEQLWREVKKPVDVVVVMDVSGSMGGEKISAARTSLIEFVNLLDGRDRLQVILFDDELIMLTPMSQLSDKREDVTRRVSGIVEGDDTRLYDAVKLAYEEMEANGDPDHIRAIVVLSDGQDTASELSLGQLLPVIHAQSESGSGTKIFTIAFGGDADKDVLQQIAEPTGGKLYEGDPKTIREVYADIATFF